MFGQLDKVWTTSADEEPIARYADSKIYQISICMYIGRYNWQIVIAFILWIRDLEY